MDSIEPGEKGLKDLHWVHWMEQQVVLLIVVPERAH